MLFQKKPLLYFEFLERRIRNLVMDAQSRTILEKNEILFDTEILHEGRIINQSLLENRLDALVTEKMEKCPSIHSLAGRLCHRAGGKDTRTVGTVRDQGVYCLAYGPADPLAVQGDTFSF